MEQLLSSGIWTRKAPAIRRRGEALGEMRGILGAVLLSTLVFWLPVAWVLTH